MTEKSIILVTSPFQVLCAREAIQAFNIIEFKIAVITTENDNRKEQISQTLSCLNLSYECFIIKTASFHEVKRIGHILTSEGKYKNVFIGDCCDVWLVTLAISVTKMFGRLMYLDDGASTISFMEGYKKNAIYLVKRRILTIIGFFITVKKPTFFTIFKVDGCRLYDIIYNDFSSLNKDVSNMEKKGLYVIGTNINAYCKEYSLEFLDYLNSFRSVIEESKKTQGDVIYYIEHGRCVNNEIRALCESKGIVVVRPNVPIEFYFIKNKMQPLVVWGFDTTALYTLKRMFKSCDCINIQIKNRLNMNHPFQNSYKKLLLEIGVQTNTIKI